MREWNIQQSRRCTKVSITDFYKDGAAMPLGEEPPTVAFETIFEWLITQFEPGDSVAWNGRTLCWAQRPDNFKN